MRGLSLAQKGAFTDLLFFEWDDGPLPNDPEILMRMLGVNAEEWSRVVLPILDAEFRQNADCRFVNERLEAERRKSIQLRDVAHERAKAGGDATKEKWKERKAQGNGAHSNPS